MRKCAFAAVFGLFTAANAAMPVCSSTSCPTMCSCVESKCESLYSSCAGDSQCNTLLNCMLGCSCNNVICALGCVAGKTLDPISDQVKTCATACVTSERITLYDRKVVPPTWNVVSRASPHQRVHFLVALKQQNLKKLEELFWDVSNPKSKSWQQFMTKDQVGKLVAAKPQDIATVKNWLDASLSKNAIVTYSADGVEVRCSAKDAEKLFET